MHWVRLSKSVLRVGVAIAAVAAPGVAGAAVHGGAAAPVAMRQQVAPDDYRFIDRADALWDAIGDAPPDYAFPFEDAQPWAWQTEDGHAIIVEDAGDEGIRSYYFAPGERSPFLIVEPGRSFGFDGGDLVVVYGDDGTALPGFDPQDEDAAMDLYARARRLKRAMGGGVRETVDAGAWVEASPVIFNFIQVWDEGRGRVAGWDAYRARSRAEAWRRQLEQERLRRRRMAEIFAHWRDGGYRGPPPGHWHRPWTGGPGGGPARPRAARPGR